MLNISKQNRKNWKKPRQITTKNQNQNKQKIQNKRTKTSQPKTNQKTKNPTNQPNHKTMHWGIVSSKCKCDFFHWVSRVEFYCSLWPGKFRLLHLLCHPRVKTVLWSSKSQCGLLLLHPLQWSLFNIGI